MDQSQLPVELASQGFEHLERYVCAHALRGTELETTTAIAHLRAARRLMGKILLGPSAPGVCSYISGEFNHWMVHRENVPGEGATEFNAVGEVTARGVPPEMLSAIENAMLTSHQVNVQVRQCSGCRCCKSKERP